jgi:hypothetical protein
MIHKSLTSSFGFACLALAAVLGLASDARAEFVIYDGTLGTQMSSQGWVYNGDGGALFTPTTGTTRSAGANSQILNTTGNSPNSDRAGFFRAAFTTPVPVNAPLPITFDRTLGYDIFFDLKLNSESHTSNDRAGFSIIALGHDNQGIELGFWNDRIFAQNVGFGAHGEEQLFSTPATMTRYHLNVSGSNYTLSAPGMTDLSGSLRNYSGFGFPYDKPNFLFFGDDTTSAMADVQIGFVSVVPEPGTIILAIGMIGFCLIKFRKLIRS